MGLFSKKKKKYRESLEEFEYRKDEISKSLRTIADDLYDTKELAGQTTICKFIEKLRNLQVLELASEKTLTAEAYSYHQGRIDALTNVLQTRENYIQDVAKLRAKEDKKKTDNKLARPMYQRQQSSSAGLSI